MPEPADLGPSILEALYSEALGLTEDVREAFDLTPSIGLAGADEDLARITLSREALRTTTRMMHAVAWLLNQRAYLAGELSGVQIERHGRLPPAQPRANDADLARLDPALAGIVRRSERFYERVARLDAAWRRPLVPNPAPVRRLQDCIATGLGR